MFKFTDEDTEIAQLLKQLGVEKLTKMPDPGEDIDFFNKLYELVTPTVFSDEYRARFFHWANLFLSSSKLTAQCAAAFIKKFARISLNSEPRDLTLILAFICNMLMRHPTLKSMIDRIDTSALENITDQDSFELMIKADPYDTDTKDINDSRALESSLWELMPLRYHWHPSVTHCAMWIKIGLPQMEYDLNEVMDSFIDMDEDDESDEEYDSEDEEDDDEMDDDEDIEDVPLE